MRLYPLAQLHFTNGVNDVDQSLELASTALHIATGYYFDQYGEPYIQRMGFQHKGYLKPGGALVMKVYEVGAHRGGGGRILRFVSVQARGCLNQDGRRGGCTEVR